MNPEIRIQALNAAMVLRKDSGNVGDVLSHARQIEDYLSGTPPIQTVGTGSAIGDIARLNDLAKVAR